jgi:protein ImuA
MTARARASNPVLAALRARVAAIEAAEVKPGRVLSLGDPRVDACLPGGGLPLGRWHEITGEGLEAEDPAAAAGFAARLAAGLAEDGGETVWVFRRDDLYAPGLAGLGLDPARLLFVAVRKDAEVLAAVEDALGATGVAAVVGEAEALDLTAGRRLQLACERTGATGLILRRRRALPAGRKIQGRGEATAATTRWRIGPEPSRPEQAAFTGLGPPRWRVELERCRGGRTGAWILEAGDGPHPLRMVAELADHDLEETASRRTARG